MPLARLLLYQAEVQLSALRSTELATDDPGVLAAQPARGTGDPCTKGLAIQRRHRTSELGGRHVGRCAGSAPAVFHPDSRTLHGPIDITKKFNCSALAIWTTPLK